MLEAREAMESATLDDFTAKRTKGATTYTHKSGKYKCVIFDTFPNKDIPSALLAEIKASIIRSVGNALRQKVFYTLPEVVCLLGVSQQRVNQLVKAGRIIKLGHGMYDSPTVDAYKAKRGDKKGGPYPAG